MDIDIFCWALLLSLAVAAPADLWVEGVSFEVEELFEFVAQPNKIAFKAIIPLT